MFVPGRIRQLRETGAFFERQAVEWRCANLDASARDYEISVERLHDPMTQPSRVRVTLKHTPEGGVRKLMGITVNVGKE